MRYLSLCSGIEAATVAWAPLGWQPVAFAEVEPFACELLAHRFPDVPNLGDITAITERDLEQLGPVDLVVGGTPCQDLSIAGQRAGLAGERSRLFFDYVRIFDAARSICGARFALWENVPNALGNRGGRDFARVVSALAGLDELAPPRGGWGTEGLALGARGLVEWCVLDAQWFGLAQRRGRVFALVDSGNWRGRPPVLLESESMRGNSPPSREATADIAGTLAARALDGSSACGGDGRDGLLVAGAEEAAANHLVPCYVPDVAEPITATNARLATHAGNNPRPRNVIAVADGAPAITSREGKGPDSKVTLGALIACFDRSQVTSATNRSTCDPGTAALARSAKPPAIALEAAAGTVGVRRLTPRECERLFGFPDDYTAIVRADGKPASDTARYAALGNSMAVTVLDWIGRKLEASIATAGGASSSAPACSTR